MTPVPNCGLSADIQQQLKSVFTKNKSIEKVLLYGSRAMGNFKRGSDIDLTIYGPNLSLQDLLAIQIEIDDLMLPYKVDLSLFHQLDNDQLIAHIHKVGVVFYLGTAHQIGPK